MSPVEARGAGMVIIPRIFRTIYLYTKDEVVQFLQWETLMHVLEI